jgi:lipopolysaccharide transport protein LptA
MYFTSIKTWDLAKFRQKEGEKTPQGRGFQENYFKSINYYISQEKMPALFLVADELLHNGETGYTSFTSPDGHFYTQNRDKIFYRGKTGSFNKNNSHLNLKEEVKVTMDKIITTGDKMDYFLNKDKIHVLGNVVSIGDRPETHEKIEITSEQAYFWPKKRHSNYLDNVKGKVKRKRVYEESIDFSANKLFLDEPNNFMNLNGDVVVKKQSLTAKGHRGEVYLENYNKKLKYFVLYDDVKVTEKILLEGKSYIRRAYGEQLDGYMNENKIVLTGYPRAYQFDDVIKGNIITLRENNEVVEVDDSNTKFKIR